MEYVEGEPLSVRVQRGPLTPDEVLDVAVQLFDALDEAHARNIVHRDLKPANILLTPRGRVKILDFGLARIIDETSLTETAATAARLNTEPGLVLGTVQYMSPEQALGREVDHRSDIFSAGVVLYELLTGRPPFVARSVTETLDRIVHAQPESISRLNYAASPELERIVKRALEKEAARRYQTARDTLIDLANLKRDSDSAIQPERAVAGKSKRPSKTIQSLAVLPLATPIADAEIEYIADGITESLINALSQLPKLKVMARSTVFRYKGRDADAQVVGRELQVRAVLLGRLETSGDRVLVRAELVDAADGAHIWGGQFQRIASDVLVLQEEIAQEIAHQLRLRLTRDDKKRLQKRHTANARAYEAYLRGRFELQKRTSDGFSKAIECFERAIAEDPQYALAYAGLADAYTLVGAAAYVVSPAEAVNRARRAAEHAIRLDDGLAEAHSAIGFVRFRIDWDWVAAEASLRRACELNAGHAPAHHRYALLVSALARHDEALAAIRTAHALDPLSPIIGSAYGRALHFSRRYDDAIAQLRRTLEIDQQFPQAHFDLALSFMEVGRYDDAIAELNGQLQSGRRSVMVAVLGNALARSGRRDRAMETLAELRAAVASGSAAQSDPVYVLAGLGDIDEALDWLERGMAARVGTLVYAKVEPMLDPLRSRDRFRALLQRVGLG
jgi:serine/threonine-protein kinase